MLRLFQAGLVAAFSQFIAVGLATLVVSLSARHGLIAPASSDIGPAFDSQSASISPLLTWIYLLTALGVALTSNRFVDFTTARIRGASRLMRPPEPDHATKTLLVQLWLAAIGFAILALRSPPDSFIEAGRYLGCTGAALIVWPGMMSIGAAGFGANAQAVRNAL